MAVLDQRRQGLGALKRRAGRRERDVFAGVRPAEPAVYEHCFFPPKERGVGAALLLCPAVPAAAVLAAAAVLDAEGSPDVLRVVAVERDDVGGERHGRRLVHVEQVREQSDAVSRADSFRRAGVADALQAPPQLERRQGDIEDLLDVDGSVHGDDLHAGRALARQQRGVLALDAVLARHAPWLLGIRVIRHVAVRRHLQQELVC